jgi:pyrroloquinoline-quinone synthase
MGGGPVTNDIWTRIEEARRRWNVLEHPFYVRWSNGELSAEELGRYSGQYRHAVKAIASMSSSLAREIPAHSRDGLREHAAEEAEHVVLWDRFVQGAGGDVGAPPTAETQECVAEWSRDDGTLATLARLYAIESGQPEISRVKRKGLTELYGFEEGPATEYFRVHEQRDAEHAAESRQLIETLAEDGDQDRIVEAAESAFRANWRLLDGV